MKIEDIDKNFRISKIGDKEFIYFNALEKPFALEGFPWRQKTGKLRRLPEHFTKNEVNEGALGLANHTTGGAIRFRTDSKQIALKAKLVYSCDMNHMPRTGSAGFDLFRGKTHIATAQPNPGQEVMELLLLANNPDGMADFTLNLPLYGGAEEIEIGLLPGSALEEATPHAVKKPVLFYGSSITQGGCASRPGNAYTTMLCRETDAEQINLGFSGSGRGEIAVAKAIAELPLSVFVMDYDHNAPNVEHLQATHEPFFRAIRERQPELPVIFMSRCDAWDDRSNGDAERRRAIIRKTYENALAIGDKNVRFIDGATLFGDVPGYRSWCTVDTCHPNDIGFFMMFRTVLPVLQEVLKK